MINSTRPSPNLVSIFLFALCFSVQCRRSRAFISKNTPDVMMDETKRFSRRISQAKANRERGNSKDSTSKTKFLPVQAPQAVTPSPKLTGKKTQKLKSPSSPGRKRKRKHSEEDLLRKKQDGASLTTKKERKVITNSPSPRHANGDEIILTSDDIASVNPSEPYRDLNVPPAELRPSATLTTGQCFHWRVVQQQEYDIIGQQEGGKKSAWGSHNDTEWVGTIRTNTTSIVVAIRETLNTTLYRPLTKLPKGTNLRQVLYDYFQLQHNLEALYKEWSKADSRLSVIAGCIPGVRIIDQDPWECLVSFICSSNNNIPRITKMLLAIRQEYGQPLLRIGNHHFYSFPSLEELAARATDESLRAKCGMGYRSTYVLKTMKILLERGGESYLQSLRHLDDAALVQQKLCEFSGVGRKVADCVAIFSLQQDAAIPVDVHVWNIVRRDYDANGDLVQAKSLTPGIYEKVGDLFRARFPVKPSWAHSLLFVAELPSFRPVLPQEIIDEMEKFRREEQLRKQELKSRK